MDKDKTCFFTGHRRINERKINDIEIRLAENIEKMIIEHDVSRFIAGGALGFDTMAAGVVIKMREKYPEISLVLYIPCFGQSALWNDTDKFHYRMILSKADEIVYITEQNYTDNCMRLRNLRMVKDSAFCIAFCIIQKSGTGFTVRNARESGVQIINIADEIYNK